MQYEDGIPSPMVMTARHLVNFAPSETYSASRSRRPSRPSVTFSPGAKARSLAPLSTLMPGRMPREASSAPKFVPSAALWRSVSSKRMTPLMYSSIPSVVKRSSR